MACSLSEADGNWTYWLTWADLHKAVPIRSYKCNLQPSRTPPLPTPPPCPHPSLSMGGHVSADTPLMLLQHFFLCDIDAPALLHSRELEDLLSVLNPFCQKKREREREEILSLEI